MRVCPPVQLHEPLGIIPSRAYGLDVRRQAAGLLVRIAAVDEA